MKNMDRDGYRISSMQEVLEALTGDVFPVGPDLPYVMTNSSGVYGAAGILNKSMIARFAEKFGTDLYILPSSIHELLILPDFERAEAEELGQIVRAVNRAEVDPEDRLSDHVYYYDRQTDEIQIAG